MKQNAAKKLDFIQSNDNSGETMTGAIVAWKDMGGEKGRGVFALRDIRKGEIIEVAPVVIVPATSINGDGEAPDGYLLDWDPETEGEEHCMPLGYIMLYNHSNKPTLELEADMEDLTMTAMAARNIKKGEELTWDYSCELWFDEE